MFFLLVEKIRQKIERKTNVNVFVQQQNDKKKDPRTHSFRGASKEFMT